MPASCSPEQTGELTFLSDVAAELDAAEQAGWHTIGVSRPSDGSPDVGHHRRITSFADLP